MKKVFKKIGKFFIGLTPEDKQILSQSILVVDNGYSWLGHLGFAIMRIRNNFPRAKITVLTLTKRKSSLQKDFPELKFILPSQKIKPRRYQIALQMLQLRKEKYDFIILVSLDISPIVVSLLFLKAKVILYNQWGQWWSLKLREINEIFKVAYIKKKTKFSFKNFLKKVGLFFVLLERKDEEALRHSILIVDNGYALFGQIDYAIQQIREALPLSRISILGLEQREQLKDKFPDFEYITSGQCIIRKYRLARHIFRLRKKRYNYIILLFLDITPIIVSILFMKSKVLLHNQWYQWWLLKPKPIKSYLMVIPLFIINIIIFAYLLISTSWIFLKTLFNTVRSTFFQKKTV